MKAYDTLCYLALLGFAIIIDRFLPGVTRNHKFLFPAFLTHANCLLLIAPKLIICKKDLVDREKNFVHSLEKAAIADGSGKLATATIVCAPSSVSRMILTLGGSLVTSTLFSSPLVTERLDILERVYASLLSAQEFKDAVIKSINSIKEDSRIETLETIESLDQRTKIAARYHFHYDFSELKKLAKRTGLKVDTHAKRAIQECKKDSYAEVVDVLERAGQKVRSYWELPVELRGTGVLLNYMQETININGEDKNIAMQSYVNGMYTTELKYLRYHMYQEKIYLLDLLTEVQVLRALAGWRPIKHS